MSPDEAQPRKMTPTEQQLWDKWFSASFKLSIDKYTEDVVCGLVEEIAKTMAEREKIMRSDFEAKIAKLQGVSVRGTYDPNVNYHQHDIVARNNSSFIALRDGPGDCPGPDWQLLAGQGKRGRDGGSAEIVSEIAVLRRQVAELRTQIKALQATQDGDVVDLPKWPLRNGAST